ncbi:hypothetical protein [Pseudoalteromonas sp. CnMc7-37]|uniref:DNA polymerase III subunit beta family protein n=1 Tax=Pseudoalteromonas sp. CnMc7-37 TaxID=2954496 RepID=UPI00209809BF|nr:hypothetical protein [Pseudoalteromonas sp. CnMc7-37]MCO7208581.1 hypothetical protein [Pseudoalteromonas sp. CnMc7-37]
MNFSISLSTAKHLFVDACGVANGSKCNISALDYIHFSLLGGIAEVLGTDTQSIVRQSSPIDAFEDYEICIEAKKLNTVISSFTDESKSLKFQFDEDKVIVKHGRSRASIATMPCNSYPIPKIVIPNGFQFSCDAESFKSAISGIFYAKANNDVRPFLNHINFSINSHQMKLYTSDGHRLATDIVQLENSVDDLKGILPFKLAEMLLQTQPDGTLGFFFDDSHFYCSTGGTVYGSKFVATEFTDVSEILNTELFQSIKIAKSELLDSVKRIKGFVQSAKIAKLTISLKGQELLLNANADKGNEIDDVVNTELLQANVSDGYEPVFTLNPNYLFDAVKSIKSNSVCISFTSKALLKITDPDNANINSVIMSMR